MAALTFTAASGTLPIKQAGPTRGRSTATAFWSRNGRLLYYLTTTPYLMLRGEVRARHFMPDLPADGESIPIVTLGEVVVPAFMNGAAPITAPDQIVFILGDFRGDVWLRDA